VRVVEVHVSGTGSLEHVREHPGQLRGGGLQHLVRELPIPERQKATLLAETLQGGPGPPENGAGLIIPGDLPVISVFRPGEMDRGFLHVNLIPAQSVDLAHAHGGLQRELKHQLEPFGVGTQFEGRRARHLLLQHPRGAPFFARTETPIALTILRGILASSGQRRHIVLGIAGVSVGAIGPGDCW
jgi:hypothetical protein